MKKILKLKPYWGLGILAVILLVGITFSIVQITKSSPAEPDPGHPWSQIGDVVTGDDALLVSRGGTGQTSANAAFNALAPSQTGNSGKFLTTDGADTSWATESGVMTYLGGTQLTVDSATLDVSLSAAKEYIHCTLAGPGASAVGILMLRFDGSSGVADYGSTANYALAGASFVDTQDASDSEIQLTGTITTSTNLPSMWNLYISNISEQAKQVQWDGVQGKAVGTIGDIFIGQGTYYITAGQIATSVNFLRSAGNYLAGTYAFCEGRDI